MPGKNKAPLIIENVTVTDIVDDGKAIGRVDEMVVIISHAIPGDNVDVRVTKKRKKYVEGIAVRINKLSELRVDPVCEYFGICGGCKWQDFDYRQQLYYKQKNVTDCLVRIGKLSIPEVAPIIAADPIYFYRNKLEFTFSSNRWLNNDEISSGNEILNRNALGFHMPGMFDKILDIDKCYLQSDPSNDLRNSIRDFAQQENIPFFDLRNHEGLLRTLMIRISSTGEIMVLLNFYYDDRQAIHKLLDFIWTRFPELTSLMYVINPKPHDNFTDLEVQLYKGKPYIMEEMEGLHFKVGPKSFYQTNSRQVHHLYRMVRQMACLSGNEIVYDLYTGTGTIANFIASQARKVIGIEYIEEAIQDARYNSLTNGITNTLFFAGDMKDILNYEFIRYHGKPDVIILDPPRAGVHPKVISSIKFARARYIVYVSCNPASQARDLALLQDEYEISSVQPVDMFPHTHHVENIVQLIRRDYVNSNI